MKIIATFFIALAFLSCSNRFSNGKRQGFWKERDTVNGIVYIAKGRYNKNYQTGTWIYIAENKRYKKEKYQGTVCHTFIYGEDEKLKREGYTRLDTTATLIHWYYSGDWTTFDSIGKPIWIDTYYKGEIVGEKDLTDKK
ncbi:MAG: hypothetical protein EOO50_08720 [Flavobacterium sp.]|uniref:hypothetical protein n=1 Tax=Flavobacterium sp. TaxID=239 RepID=UPI0012298EDA|nr:hypothetical protein [Flavobacterium sp.]RZJ66764.1 MAG: hypothetical protein EOO50_08720 [Flavobacterium sp.]